LLLTSLQRLATVDPGYRPENLLVVRATHDKGGTNAVPGADPKQQRDAEAARTLAYFEELRQRAAQLPGVRAVSFTDGLPVDAVRSDGTFWIEGRPDPSAGDADVRQGAVWRLVGPDYFSTIGIPVREGRQLDRRDRAGGLRTVVINRTMAESSWPGRSPLGARIRCGWYDGTMEWMTIVGVVADSHHRSLDEPIFPEMYLPALQHPALTKIVKLVMRTEGDPTPMAGTVQRALREVDPEIPMQATTAEVMVAETLSAPRFRTLLLGLFAVTALLLALVGVAGVMGYMVSERRVEIGVRLAIGARAETILKHFVLRALRLTLIGLLLGLAGALAAARAAGGAAFRGHTVRPGHPGGGKWASRPVRARRRGLGGAERRPDLSHGGPAGGLTPAAGLFTRLAPVRRATQLDPMIALRADQSERVRGTIRALDQ
jgi:putative ABC transport system permease protein